MNSLHSSLLLLGTLTATAQPQSAPSRPLLDASALLGAQSFWDNRDWTWYQANIPFLDCPDESIQTTYYYRWELLTKHLTYGSTKSGYAFTEFIDRPFWSGAHGAISCAAGHQLHEARWLRDPCIARDYARYWFRTEGAQPRRYSTWLADSIWAVHQVHPSDLLVADLLPDLVLNYRGWEREHFVPEVGLFWQTGHDDGMEFNINSRQTKDIVRGAPGFRPTLNAYMYADALAISRAADLAGQADLAASFRAKAASLRQNLQDQLWDPKRSFFFHKYRDNEEKDGFTIEAGTLTHQSGQFAGSPFGRELIGYVPWQFNLPDKDKGYERAWRFLMDPDHFKAPFGPTVAERRDPLFLVTDSCCWWSGQSWPYATTQTLEALANVLQSYPQQFVTRDDYLALLQTYSGTHRKDGRPYLAEAAHPDTGSWKGYDGYNHSEHYFHSGYVDLIITGLVGLVPRDDDILEINPLAPDDWPYFALDAIPYRGRTLTIAWDRDGQRYGLGPGFHVLADSQRLVHVDLPRKLTVPLPPARARADATPPPANFAANNDGTYFPRVIASFTAPGSSTGKLIDGNYWYHIHPPNRWTAAGSPVSSDSLVLDFGVSRRLHSLALYFLDDPEAIAPPASYALEIGDGDTWTPLLGQTRQPEQPEGQRANRIMFPEQAISRLRVTLNHRDGGRTGLTELEAWGPADQPLDPAPPPAGNLAHNPGDQPFPKATASFTSRFDAVARVNDGIVSFQPNPNNRWTAYESLNESDWVAIDLGQPREVGRIELAIYDDHGGVQAPADYVVETWNGAAWTAVVNPRRAPAEPMGGQFNEVAFDPVATSRVRVVFTHRPPARSGVSELLLWAR